jgi:DNA-binding response OmpR family regulator
MLPVIDGFHLCQKLDEDHSIELKPMIVIISGRESDWDKNLGKACGAESYFVKPIDHAAFIHKIEEILA